MIKNLGLNAFIKKSAVFQYSINPWMGGIVDKEKAFKQWNALKDAISAQGVQVRSLTQ